MSPSANPATKMSAQISAHFLITELLGQSPSTTVWEVVDQRNGALSALKVPRADLDADDRARTLHRLRWEAAVLASLGNHPGIVRCFGFNNEAGGLLLELVNGAPLRTFIDTGLNWPSVVRLMTGLAHTLNYLESQGIIHGDLNAKNILVTSGETKLIDFAESLPSGSGFNRSALKRSYPSLDLESTAAVSLGEIRLVCSAGYVAPELVRNEAATHAVDVYAFGVLLYSLLTGKPLFIGSTNQEVALKHAFDRPPRFPLFHSAPKALKQLVMRCLDKNPSNRPRAGEIARELDTLV